MSITFVDDDYEDIERQLTIISAAMRWPAEKYEGFGVALTQVQAHTKMCDVCLSHLGDGAPEKTRRYAAVMCSLAEVRRAIDHYNQLWNQEG